MNTAKRADIKPDYHWIKLDETKHWNNMFLIEIGPNAKITSTYIFDKNSVTYCCELTPSYELHRVATDFSTSREMTEYEREIIDAKIFQAIEGNNDDVAYHHCSTIDEHTEKGVKVPCKSHQIGKFVGCDNDVTIEEIREYYLGNPW